MSGKLRPLHEATGVTKTGMISSEKKIIALGFTPIQNFAGKPDHPIYKNH